MTFIIKIINFILNEFIFFLNVLEEENKLH